MLQSTINAVALAPLPFGMVLSHAQWRPVPDEHLLPAERRLATRLPQMRPGPTGQTLAPPNALLIDGKFAARHVPAPAEDVTRYTRGVFSFNQRDTSLPVVTPVEPGSLPEGCRGFVNASDEAFAEKALNKALRKMKAARNIADPERKRRRRRKKLVASDDPALSPEERQALKKFEAVARDERRNTTKHSIAKGHRIRKLHARRLENGWSTEGGVIAGERLPAMCERLGQGITMRSQLNASLKLTVANVASHRRGVYSSDDKCWLEKGLSKLLALDKAYIQMRQRSIGYIVQELDTCWQSIGFLMANIALHLPDPAFWPNLVVCRVKDGVLIRPHLIWFMPPGSAVWNDLYNKDDRTGDPRCRRLPIALLRRVQRGLCARLVPLGADPLYAHHGRVKNPLCGAFATFCIHDQWQTLDAWKNATRTVRHADGSPMLDDLGSEISEPLLDMNAGLETMVAASVAAGHADATGSNRMYRDLEPVLIRFMQNAQRTRSPAFLSAWKQPGTWGEWMASQIRTEALIVTGGGHHFERILLLRCRATRRVWEVNANGSRRRRRAGRDASAIVAADLFYAGRKQSDPTAALKTRRKVGGTETSRLRREATALRVAEAIVGINEQGINGKTAVIKQLVATGVIKQSQAYVVFDGAMALVPGVIELRRRLAQEHAIAAQIEENRLKILRNKEIVDFSGEFRNAAHDKKQVISTYVSPVKRADLPGIRSSSQPIMATTDPVNPTDPRSDQPNKPSSEIDNGGPRPIIARPRSLLSQQLWAAVEAVRASHRCPDRPTLH